LDSIKSTLISSATVNVPYPNAGAPTGSAPRLDIYRALAQVNHTPTAVGLTNSSLNENTNTTAGVDVGVLIATDLDTCDKYSYSIAGGADAASFSIDTATNSLRISAGVLNFEAKASYAVTVRVTDFFGAFFDQALTVSVNNVNEAPSIGSQTFSVNEDSANGTAVGTVSASDPDAGDTKTFSITAGNTGSAFAISPTTGAITVNNTLSYATTPSYALTVKVTDSGGLFASATVTVNVNSVAATNHAPNISAQTFSVSESSSNGTAVGTVLASDPDAGDSLSYSITAGNTGNAFALNAGTGALTVNNALDYATTPSYALTVQVTDTGSLSASATMTVNVSAASAPAPTPTPPPAAPPASGGGGGGCSVMPAGDEPDSSLLLVMMVLLAYARRRRWNAPA
jgi:MYXO-CTERM domain-containing protein